MNKAIGIFVIGLGIIMIAIGIMGNQSQILADLKQVNPLLRSNTGTTSGTTAAANTGGTANNSSGGTTAL